MLGFVTLDAERPRLERYELDSLFHEPAAFGRGQKKTLRVHQNLELNV
jgi:hypothetical protein